MPFLYTAMSVALREVSVGGSGASCGQYCEEVLRCCCTSWSMVDFISVSSFWAFWSSGRCVPVHSCSNCLESSPCQFCLRDSTSWSTLVMSFWMASACCCRTLPWALTSSSFIPSQAMTFSFACVPPTDSGSSPPDQRCRPALCQLLDVRGPSGGSSRWRLFVDMQNLCQPSGGVDGEHSP